MTQEAQNVAHILALNGGPLVGKTRLQKTFYFLEVLGVGFGFDYEYYHYGPFSDELSDALDDAVALELVSSESRTSQHLQSYVVYTSKVGSIPDSIEETDADKRRQEILRVLSGTDAISIELAATVHFLGRAGYDDPAAETKKRKPSKATPDRMTRALGVLSSLNLLAA